MHFLNILYKKQLLFLLSVIAFQQLNAQPPIIYSHSQKILVIGHDISILKDTSNRLSAIEVANSNKFIPSNQKVPNLGEDKATFWIKFEIINETSTKNLILDLENPLIKEAELYSFNNNKVEFLYKLGSSLRFNSRKYLFTDLLFDLNAPPNLKQTFLLKIKTTGSVILPLFIGPKYKVWEALVQNEIIIGIYIGIMFALLAYNLFIYFSLREKSYIFYVLYLLFIGLTQISLLGYPFKYLWPNYPNFEQISIILLPAIGGSCALLFTKFFLDTKRYVPKIDRLFIILIAIYAVAVVSKMLHYDNISYKIIDINGSIGSLLVLICAIITTIKGFRHAKFFLIAWIILIFGILLFSLQNLNILPYSVFAKYTMYVGTCIEVILLSFALADKINIYKKEKELSQAQAILALREKEEFASQQNVILEKKVYDRTNDLQKTNNDLELTLKQLKESQSQLVDAEKMASLGQLTAGIAHEINNPINFVKSNIKPLQLDIEDMRSLIKKYEEMHQGNFDDKRGEIQAFRERIDFDYVMEEINTLLSGIEDGATRTADIVKGLRTFSRLDESDLKEADICEGIDNTLMLLNHTIPKDISVIRNYQEIPKIECYPGKLNQVFMNLLTNAIQAMGSSVGGGEKKIIISTERLNEDVIIRVADTGPGIPENVRDRIFEPFFTTKDVGEGTGLGLSIVYNIIEKHHGKITVQSEENKGTEFVITLPLKQSDFWM